jgi:hypothetical protein
MEHDVIWQPWDEPGIEHVRLTEDTSGAVADSFLFRVFDLRPVRMRYEIRVDDAWRLRQVDIDQWDPDHRQLMLRSDGEGSWIDADGRPLPDLASCIDVDLTATAFTNTLPIRRLGLKPGEAAVIDVAYIRVPELSVEAVQQRYTCLAQSDNGARYRYEGLGTDFRTELDVDASGFVLDYPDIFRRVALG